MKEIIIKYLEDTATDAEKLELLHWLRKKENRKDFIFHRLSWKNGLDKNSFPAGSEETWNSIQSLLLEKSVKGWQKSRKIQMFLRYAAIFFLLTTLGLVAGLIMQKTGTGKPGMTNIMADNGQIARVELPDGSQVWVNSGSLLSYDSRFGVRNRELWLKGEAYFDISGGGEMPLVVNSSELSVRVNGTKFNINAYPGIKNISVALEEGSVELFRPENTSFHYGLKPGELAVFDLSTQKLTVSAINISRYTSWKEGMMHIYNQTLEEVAERLKTRYNQEFRISEEVKDYHYTFTIKNESLQEILSLIEQITPVKAEQHDTVIILKSAKVPVRRVK